MLCSTVWQIWQGTLGWNWTMEDKSWLCWWYMCMLNAVRYIDIILATEIFNFHASEWIWPYIFQQVRQSKSSTTPCIYMACLQQNIDVMLWQSNHWNILNELNGSVWPRPQKKTTIVSDLLQAFQREEWKIFQRCISMSKSDFIHKLVSMVMMDKKVLTFFLTFLYLELILFIYCIIVLFSGD